MKDPRIIAELERARRLARKFNLEEHPAEWQRFHLIISTLQFVLYPEYAPPCDAYVPPEEREQERYAAIPADLHHAYLSARALHRAGQGPKPHLSLTFDEAEAEVTLGTWRGEYGRIFNIPEHQRQTL